VGAPGVAVGERGAKLTPSIGDWATPAMSAGGSMPMRSSSVGMTSIAWTYWCRVSPSVPRRAGQWTTSGSATPPSCVSRLNRFSGVLPAHAQPQG